MKTMAISILIRFNRSDELLDCGCVDDPGCKRNIDFSRVLLQKKIGLAEENRENLYLAKSNCLGR